MSPLPASPVSVPLLTLLTAGFTWYRGDCLYSVPLACSYVLTRWTLAYAENVASQFLSLRQSLRDQRSPLDFAALKSPIPTGFAHKPPHWDAPPKFSLLARLSPNLPTAPTWYGTLSN